MNEDLEFYLACSRLRSSRRKKRALRLDFDKHLIGLSRETEALTKQRQNLGHEPLNPPYQRGWKCVFVLRDDVGRSIDASFFERLLEKINTTKYHWRKDFRMRKRTYGRKIYIDHRQKLQEFDPGAFDKMKFTDKEKALFELIFVLEYKQPQPRYVFTEPWRYVLRVQPNMITKVRVVDFNLERRLKEIDLFLTKHHLYPRLGKIVKGRYRWKWTSELEKEKYKSPIKNKSFADVLDEHWPSDHSMKNPRIDPGVSFLRSGMFSANGLQFQIRQPMKQKFPLFP